MLTVSEKLEEETKVLPSLPQPVSRNILQQPILSLIQAMVWSLLVNNLVPMRPQKEVANKQVRMCCLADNVHTIGQPTTADTIQGDFSCSLFTYNLSNFISFYTIPNYPLIVFFGVNRILPAHSTGPSKQSRKIKS